MQKDFTIHSTNPHLKLTYYMIFPSRYFYEEILYGLRLKVLVVLQIQFFISQYLITILACLGLQCSTINSWCVVPFTFSLTVMCNVYFMLCTIYGR